MLNNQSVFAECTTDAKASKQFYSQPNPKGSWKSDAIAFVGNGWKQLKHNLCFVMFCFPFSTFVFCCCSSQPLAQNRI